MAIIGYGTRGGSLKIELTGILSSKNALGKMSKRVDNLLDKEVFMAARDTANIAKKSIMRGVKTGRVYTNIFRTINGQVVPVGPRSGNNLSASHRASAPGEAPATDTGRLVSSITQEKTGEAEAIVGSRVVYSKFLEFGTQSMGERPFLRPALKEAAKNWEKRMAKELGGKRSRLGDFMTTGVKRSD